MATFAQFIGSCRKKSTLLSAKGNGNGNGSGIIIIAMMSEVNDILWPLWLNILRISLRRSACGWVAMACPW